MQPVNNISKELLKVFVGIDVHKIFYVVYCIRGGNLVKRGKISANPDELIKWLRSSFREEEIVTAYEAGFSGFALHRYLERNGIKNLVVNASSIEVATRDRVKTDKRDSKKLAEHLSMDRLIGIRVPSEKEENSRLITRTRDQLVKNRQQIMNRIRMKFYQFGISCTQDKKRLCLRAVNRVLAQDLSLELSMSIKCLLSVWLTINSEIRKLQKELFSQAEQDPRESTYKKVLWVGPLTARVLSNELGDLQQFRNEQAAFSYVGLTPREFTTGEHRRLGHISRQGSSRLRHILVETAWRAIKKDALLNQSFLKIAARAGKKRAIVAIARKLIGRLRAAFRKGDLYQVELLAA